MKSQEQELLGLEAAADELEKVGKALGWIPKRIKSWRDEDSPNKETMIYVARKIVGAYRSEL